MKSARIANPKNLNPTQLAVLRKIALYRACDGWIAHYLHRHPGTVAKRRLELQLAGLVKATGTLENTPHGAPAEKHELTAKGRRVLERYDRRQELAA